MKKRTKALQFDKRTAQKIIDRDEACIFCKQFYHMKSMDNSAYTIHDIMHIVNKSQGGLGVEQNGALGCRYHHNLLDNGNKGLRAEMLLVIDRYMMDHYPNWAKENLIYKK